MRTTNSVSRHSARKRLMKSVRGYYGARHRNVRQALIAQKRAEQHAFVGRKLKKRDMRRLWITRINIASRTLGLSYSRLIAGLNKADIRLNRKQLSEMAIHEPAAFSAVVDQAKAKLA